MTGERRKHTKAAHATSDLLFLAVITPETVARHTSIMKCLLIIMAALLMASSLPMSAANCPSDYTVAVLSDVHIGENDDCIPFAEAAVAKINSLTDSMNIRWVFITGDLTSTAYPTQYTTVASILAKLKPVWIPIIGNHDTWIYNKSYNEPKPTGDTLFANTFLNQFNQVQKTAGNDFQFDWENKPTWNPTEQISSWFANWELRYCGATYYGLDWNSRQPALNIAGYKGAWPGAELHNYTGGTFQWLDSKLANLASTSPFNKITMLHHHPYRAPLGVPDSIYGFSHEKKYDVVKVLQKHFPMSSYWGIVTGHWHRWYNGTALDEYPQFLQWETEACKVSSAFSLVHVHGNQITHIDKMYGTH